MAGILATKTLRQALHSEFVTIAEFVPRRIGGNTRPQPRPSPASQGKGDPFPFPCPRMGTGKG